MAPDWALEVGIAPEAALARVKSAINRPKKRALGLFKLENEYVGLVQDDTFEIWERQQRAVHAKGTIRKHEAGTRIEVHFELRTLARALLPVFLLLYAVAALGAAQRNGVITGSGAVAAVIGAIVLCAFFFFAARRQRADLQSFLERLFRDPPHA